MTDVRRRRTDVRIQILRLQLSPHFALHALLFAPCALSYSHNCLPQFLTFSASHLLSFSASHLPIFLAFTAPRQPAPIKSIISLDFELSALSYQLARIVLSRTPCPATRNSQLVFLFIDLLQSRRTGLQVRPFIDIADLDVADNAFFVNVKQGSFGDACRAQDAVAGGHLAVGPEIR